MRTYCLHMLYEYREGGDTTYSDHFDFWLEWLFKYYNAFTSVEAI